MLSSSGVAYSPDNVCGTQKVAWMEGSHPKVQDGIVVRETLLWIIFNNTNNFMNKQAFMTCRVGKKVLLPMVEWGL